MDTAPAPAGKRVGPLQIVIPVLAGLLAVSAFAQWYARAVSIPRYCENPALTVAHLKRIIGDDRPAGDGATRPYVVAAKILFLVPRNIDEPQRSYLERVRLHLEGQCQ